jgi:hypothetical protein
LFGEAADSDVYKVDSMECLSAAKGFELSLMQVCRLMVDFDMIPRLPGEFSNEQSDFSFPIIRSSFVCHLRYAVNGEKCSFW